jgi:hypothetical protein
MSGGRKAVVVGVVCAIALLLAGPAAASGGSGNGYAQIFGGKFREPKIRTDGLLTVGGQETLTMTHIPRRPRLRLAPHMVAPISATICNQEPSNFDFFGPCLPEPLYPVPGTRPLKPSKKGRASLTFLMPAAYEYIDSRDPVQSHPIYLIDNQTVEVEVDVTYRAQPRTFVTLFPSKSVVVQVPAPPSP